MINFGKILKLKFDAAIHNVSDSDINSIYLIGAYGFPAFQESFYPYHIEYGTDSTEVLLYFNDINNIKFPVFLIFSNAKMGSPDMPLPDAVMNIFPDRLKPSPASEDFVEINSAWLCGDLLAKVTIPAQNSMSGENYPTCVAGNFNGITFNIQFVKAYFSEVGTSYPVVIDGYFTGTSCDTNDVPI